MEWMYISIYGMGVVDESIWKGCRSLFMEWMYISLHGIDVDQSIWNGCRRSVYMELQTLRADRNTRIALVNT
jgi:hypothetical protein